MDLPNPSVSLYVASIGPMRIDAAASHRLAVIFETQRFFHYAEFAFGAEGPESSQPSIGDL